MSLQTCICPGCGKEYGIGCSPFCRDGHGRVMPAKGFEPHFDLGLGKYVTGWGDVKQAMRQNKLDYRDPMSKERIEARRERIEAQKRG